jgi:hypothetical protein
LIYCDDHTYQKKDASMLNQLKPEIASLLAATHGHDDIACDNALFNTHIEMIQKALGQPYGDLAGVFFSNTKWFEEYNTAKHDLHARYKLIMKYVIAEICVFCDEDEIHDSAMEMIEQIE